MAIPAKAIPRPCSVKGYSFRAETWMAMWVHLWHQHVRDTVVILEEGNLPHPRCPMCEMLVPCQALNRIHWRTAQCKKVEERERRRLSEEEERAVIYREFSAYGHPLKVVTSLK